MIEPFVVAGEVLITTTKCHHDFSCITSGQCGNMPMCKVQSVFDKNMLYVESMSEKKNIACPYKMSAGSTIVHICTCPTHHAIYRQSAVSMSRKNRPSDNAVTRNFAKTRMSEDGT